jgi:hypothetical protein
MNLWSSYSEVLTISSARMKTICGLLLPRVELTASRRHKSLKIITPAKVFTCGLKKTRLLENLSTGLGLLLLSLQLYLD